MSLFDGILARAVTLPGIRHLWLRYPFGSVPTRIRYDIWERPHYAYGIYSAAGLARKLEIPAISVIEFGVAGGQGLMAMEKIAGKIAQDTGVRISCYGFDGGRGMPRPQDYRDLPYIWGEGFFQMDESALRNRLRDATLIIGQVEVTIPEFLKQSPPPIGFIAFDLDYYSSTIQAFHVFDGDANTRLPRVYCYFDDIDHPPMACHNEYIGELAAIKDFNASFSDCKLCPLNLLRNHRVHPASWNDKIYVLHDFSHPLYCAPVIVYNEFARTRPEM